MINRDMKSVNKCTYSTTTDAYGQLRTDTPTKTSIQMAVYITSQTNVNDPRYVDIDYVGITKDNTITDSNRIEIGTELCDIKYIIPSGRFVQVLMKKHE